MTASGYTDNDGDGYARDFDFNFTVGSNTSGEYVIEVYDEWDNYLGDTGYQSIGTSDTSSFEVDISDHAFYGNIFRDNVDYRLELYDTTNRSSWRWVNVYTESNDADLGNKQVESDYQDSFSPYFFDGSLEGVTDNDGDGKYRSLKVGFDVDADVVGDFYVKVYDNDALTANDLIATSPTYTVNGTASDWHYVTFDVDDSWFEWASLDTVDIYLDLYNADTDTKTDTLSLGTIGAELPGDDESESGKDQLESWLNFNTTNGLWHNPITDELCKPIVYGEISFGAQWLGVDLASVSVDIALDALDLVGLTQDSADGYTTIWVGLGGAFLKGSIGLLDQLGEIVPGLGVDAGLRMVPVPEADYDPWLEEYEMSFLNSNYWFAVDSGIEVSGEPRFDVLTDFNTTLLEASLYNQKTTILRKEVDTDLVGAASRMRAEGLAEV